VDEYEQIGQVAVHDRPRSADRGEGDVRLLKT
jgi:hypothetical protein